VKIIEVNRKPPRPPWLGVWCCTICTSKVELGDEDVRMKVQYLDTGIPNDGHLYMTRQHCPGCKQVGERWERA
jgi:hypothetical protein